MLLTGCQGLWAGGEVGGGGPTAQPTHLLACSPLPVSRLVFSLSPSQSLGRERVCSSRRRHRLVPSNAGGGMLHRRPPRRRGGGEGRAENRIKINSRKRNKRDGVRRGGKRSKCTHSRPFCRKSLRSVTLSCCHCIPGPDGEELWRLIAHSLKINICIHPALFREFFYSSFYGEIEQNLVRLILC